MSNLIKLHNGIATITDNDWVTVALPPSGLEERKQAGKVVLFKLTGEETVTAEQIATTLIPDHEKVIVPLSVFLARFDALQSRVVANELGVWIDTHELIETLLARVPELNQLPMIAVHVERFSDGRIFSLGTLLRSRYGYKNELRAFGDVLRDQLFFLKRSGFDSFLLRADRNAHEALASLHDFSAPYQGAVDEPRPLFQRYNRATR